MDADRVIRAELSGRLPLGPTAAAQGSLGAQGGTLREALRTATAAAHRTLEVLPLMRAVSEGCPSVGDYADYLARHWRVHALLEARLRPWVQAEWVAQRLVKHEALAADLASLAYPLPTALAEVPPIASFSAALGSMYVLEGATLGLSMVSRRLPEGHPALTVAGRFMSAYGEHTGARWGEFLRALEVVDRAEWDVVCRAAVATFGAFLLAFDGHGT